ncbi:hypothetical protein [Azonexus sp.]|uniref:type II toxin-antitoxin system RelB family antitoxin n=1 Tax=Azonexus sp. TaxID=1872668 RepID=UPI0027B9F351|nr:hypothetical protein [Azonexus sp.]
MSKTISPIISEFDTDEQAAHHDGWFKAQVAASIEDDQPCLPHDQVMAELEAIISEAEQQQRKSA